MYFWVKIALKSGFLGVTALIFQPLLWWLEFRLVDDMSSALMSNMSPAYFFSKNRGKVVYPFKN
jgi:hypothetical protein